MIAGRQVRVGRGLMRNVVVPSHDVVDFDAQLRHAETYARTPDVTIATGIAASRGALNSSRPPRCRRNSQERDRRRRAGAGPR